MRKLFFAGVLALAAFAPLSQFSTAVRAGEFDAQNDGTQASINIGRIKSVLKLKPEQERYWQPVESALRSLARHQAQDANGGFIRRVSGRVVSIVLNSAAIERLAVAARPLINVLNDEQKQAARTLAQEMGLGQMVAALN